MTIRESLDAAVVAAADEPACFWEKAEESLLLHLVSELIAALMKSGLYTEAEREPLVPILSDREDHPALVVPAITDARDRLRSKDALSADLADASAHVLDFIQNKRAYLEEKRQKATGLEAEIDSLMRKLGLAG